MFVVDTNVLLYASNEHAGEHETCHRLVTAWRTQPSAWFVTWPILYEFVRLLTHARVLRRPRRMEDAVAAVRGLLGSPGLSVLVPTDRHFEVLSTTVEEIRGLSECVSHDLGTAVLMREHGIRRIVTRDADFERFPFLEVVDPLVGEWPEGVRERVAPRARRARRAVRGT